MATTVPTEVKAVVTFIFISDQKNNLIPNGTGFFVMVKDEEDPNRGYGYLVTAKHVLEDESKKLLPAVSIRLNRKDGGSDLIKVTLEGPNALHLHPDPDVDLAVIPLFPSQETYDFKMIPEDLLTTAERFKEANIREGDEVFFTGLFGHFFGANRNYPVVRFGRVALLTDEKIPWKQGSDEKVKMLDLYLIEAQSFGGNSGSPVFFSLGATREPGGLNLSYKLLLAGVMQGTFLDAREIVVAETRKVPFSLGNIGIAAVVPAYKLHELLFSDHLRTARRQQHRPK